jgi:5-methyltetrahydropteroyltriglutamate--homocysteine methyltransferase
MAGRDEPNVYAFLPELTACKIELISIEAAQPNLDLKTLDGLGGKTVIFGVISMGDPAPETARVVAARIRAALQHLPPERLIPGPDWRHEIHPARNRSFQAESASRWGRHRAP